MRKLISVFAALSAVMALTAVGASTASAALPEFLPGSGTFTATSGKGTLTAGAFSITCTKDKASGSITGAKTVESTVDFESCTALGFPANSLGDSSGVILTGTLKGELCFIKETAPLEVGVYFTLPSGGIHIEIPAAAALDVVSGTVIAKAEPLNVSQTTGKLIIAAPNLTKCGGKEASLKSAKNEGAAESASEVTTEEVTFAKATAVDG